MNTIPEFRTDQPLTEQQYKHIDEVIRETAKQILIARKLAPIYGPLGFGKEAVSFDVLTEVGAGKIDLAWGAGFSEDIPNITRTNLPIPVLHKEFRINRRHLEASRTYGEPLDVSSIRSATYKVGVKEDELLLKGYDVDGDGTYEIKGFYEAAGNDYSTSSDWGTASNILPSINGAVDLLQADSIYPPYNLVCNPTQFNELFVLVSGTAEFYADVVKRRIGGEIYQSPAVAAGTAMLLAAPNSGFFDIAIGVDMTHEEAILEKSKDLWGIVYECLVPRVWETNAICKLSNI